MESRAMIGVNMLRIADYKPDLLEEHCMESVIQLLHEGGTFSDPHVGKIYRKRYTRHTRILESRKTIGKIGIVW